MRQNGCQSVPARPRAHSPRHGRSCLWAVLLGTALAYGCGEADDPGTGGFPGGPVGAGASPGVVADSGTNPVAPGGPVGPSAPSGTGTVTPSNPVGGADAGTSTTPPATGGGSVDTQWCKVKAILDKNCVACHTTPAAGGAPFPLTKYAELTAAHPTKAGKKIYERVGFRVHADKSQTEQLGVMPPGKPLAAADIALIDAWVAAGAPAGANPTCAAADGAPVTDPGVTTQEWPLKECDAVYKIVSHGSGGVTTPTMAPPGRPLRIQW